MLSLKEVTSSRITCLNNLSLSIVKIVPRYRNIQFNEHLTMSAFSIYKMKTANQTHKDADRTNEMSRKEKKCLHGYPCMSDYIYVYTYRHDYLT